MSAAAPGLQLRQVSCYIHSDKTMRCVQSKTLLAEKQKAFGPPWARHPINSKLVTNVIYFIAELLKFMIKKNKSLTYMFWSLKADPAHRRPEATLRVAGEGEPFLQFAL